MSTILYSAGYIGKTRTGHHAIVQQAGARVRWFATMGWAFFAAPFNGLAAFRRYERLKSRGVAHEKAIAQALLPRCDT